MPAVPTIRPRVVQLLQAYGPMTTMEIVAELDVMRESVTQVLRALRKRREVRIAAWTDDTEGLRRCLRPMYGLGDKPDAPKPDSAARHREARRRYYHKVKAARRATFNR